MQFDYKSSLIKLTLFTFAIFCSINLFANEETDEKYFDSLSCQICDELNNANFDEAIRLAKQAIREAKEQEQIHTQIDALSTLSYIYNQLHENDKSLEILQQAFNLAKQKQDTYYLSSIAYNIAYDLLELGYHKEAIKYGNIALEHTQSTDSIQLGSNYNLIGEAKMYLGYPKEAMTLLKTSLKLYSGTGYEIFPLGNIGDLFIQQGNFTKGIGYIKKANELSSKMGDQHFLIYSQYSFGQAYLSVNNFEKAQGYFEQYIHMADSSNDLRSMKKGYMALSELHKKKKNFEVSLSYLNKYYKLNDSISNTDIKRNIEKLQIQYETERKENELAQKLQEVKILELDKENQTNQIYAISGLLIIVLLLGLVIYVKLNGNLKKKRELIEKNKIIHEVKEQLIEEELKNKKLESQQLKKAIQLKNQDLTNFALDLSRQNEFSNQILADLKGLQKIKEEDMKQEVRKLVSKTHNHLEVNESFGKFQQNIEEVNAEFFDKLEHKFPGITPSDKHLCGLIRLGLSIKDIAFMKNISPKSVEMGRYRIRKKMQLKTADNLYEFLSKI